MNGEKITIVFEVKDREAAKAFWESHKLGVPIHGMVPQILAWGDQVTMPNEIVEGLLEIDLDFSHTKALIDLCEYAQKYIDDQVKGVTQK